MRSERESIRATAATRTRLLAAALLATTLSAFAGGASGDELEPSRRIAELGLEPEPLSLPLLVEASLLCSGVEPGRAAGYEERIAGILRDAASATAGAPGDAARGEALLAFLHEKVFRSYAEPATTLDGVLDSGRYNCVSSALLYMIAARGLGLEVRGSRTEDHALCVLSAEGREIDVETTNPLGFDPGEKKEFRDSFGRATGYAYVAPGSYSGRRPLGARGMAGLVLSNRASILERAGRFREALALGVDYFALCRDDDSRSFLADRVNNVVADRSRRGDLAGAEALAAEAARALPGEGSMIELEGRALEALAATLARDGDYEGARRAAEARRSLAGDAAVGRALAAAGDAELVGAANSMPFDRATATADRLLAEGAASPARYAQAIATIYGREAARIAAAGDYLAAAALAEEGAAKAPGDGGLRRAAAAMRRNFVIASHNAIAALYNAGDYLGAARAAEAALASAPGDESLLRDLAAAREAEARR